MFKEGEQQGQGVQGLILDPGTDISRLVPEHKADYVATDEGRWVDGRVSPWEVSPHQWLQLSQREWQQEHCKNENRRCTRLRQQGNVKQSTKRMGEGQAQGSIR